MAEHLSGNPLARCFAECRKEDRAALIPFMTAGYPNRREGLALLQTMARAGADIIELGIPFSDPLADGPTIQRSSYHALKGGMTTERTLEILAAFRREHRTPVVLFSYLNPILRYGVDEFARAAVQAGAEGLLLTDLPAGTDPILEQRLTARGLNLIRLIAPTTSANRTALIARAGAGFLYYISRTGVTGARSRLRRELCLEVEGVKRLAGGIPVAVGFGISTPDQAADVAAAADGVVVGSALIDCWTAGGVQAVHGFVGALRKAMKRKPEAALPAPHQG